MIAVAKEASSEKIGSDGVKIDCMSKKRRKSGCKFLVADKFWRRFCNSAKAVKTTPDASTWQVWCGGGLDVWWGILFC